MWCAPAHSAKVLLFWDSNPPYENVTGYEVYEVDGKIPKVGTNMVYLGLVHTNRAVILNVSQLDPCYAVAAINAFGKSSPAEVCITLSGSSVGGESRLDLEAPTSRVDSLPAEVDYLFDVRWTGTDEVGGSGLDAYDVYVSTNGGPYGVWKRGTKGTQAEFSGLPGNQYAFYSVASDVAGNRQPPANLPHASTVAISLNQPPQFVPVNSFVACVGQLFRAQFRAVDVQNSKLRPVAYSVESSDGAPVRIDSTSGILYWTPTPVYAGKFLQVGIRATDFGIPSLSATQWVTVEVKDYFELDLVSAPALAGRLAILPLSAFSSVASWRAEFEIQVETDDPVELGFDELDAKLCISQSVRLDPRTWKFTLRSCTQRPIRKWDSLGGIQFRKQGSQSAIIPVMLRNLRVTQSDNKPVVVTATKSAQVFYVGTEPIVQVHLTPNGVNLDVYGNLGVPYVVEFNTDAFAPTGWDTYWNGLLDTNASMRFLVPPAWFDQVFFRVREASP